MPSDIPTNETEFPSAEPSAEVGFTTSAEPVPQPAAQASALPDEIWERIAGRWIGDHLRNSPLSAATEAWNHLQGSMPALRKIIEEEIATITKL